MHYGKNGITCVLTNPVEDIPSLINACNRLGFQLFIQSCLFIKDSKFNCIRCTSVGSIEYSILLHCHILELSLQISKDLKELHTVNSHQEFLQSDCQIHLLYYDEGVLEIFSKSEEMLQKLLPIIVSMQATEIKNCDGTDRFFF